MRGAVAVAAGLGCFAIALGVPLASGSGLAISMLTQMAWLSIVLLANNLLLGQCGLLSFGHALHVGAGALAGVYAMRWGASGAWMPVPLIPLVGGLAALAIAVPLGFVATRAAGTAFAMVTLALGELAAGVALMLPEWFGGESGMSADRVYGRWLGLDFASPGQVYALALVYAFACGWLLFALQATALGRLFNAVRDNAARAAFLGHDPRRLRHLAYCISAFFAGIGGALGALQFEIVGTADAVGLARSGSYLLFTYLGGSGFFLGPVLGSVMMVFTTTLIAQWSSAWPLYLGSIFLLTVMFAPGGLAGLLSAAPVIRRALGWRRTLAGVAGLALLAGAFVAAVELGYRLRGQGESWMAAGRAIDPSAPAAWIAVVVAASSGVGILVALRRRS
ncbi:branched-chain amino acid ABC transporter permease [Xylophilus sp. GOD-11R]|uniref:branched-chain amino acid ABC transporter permease n=1 Tax=Xylophilus sp. GOD-11R TaxID=3089814 RepID=UPI00298C06A9|nr:branched-chain amino acid ABC transporter permease [Xylophilus sp. GOD-11R]WPB59260.1 branched-chain amino acid ABC transporter permease [Xylophilus sp. GOD-11R]